MFHDHYAPLVVAYLVTLAGWLLTDRLLPGVWSHGPFERLARPWREFGIALLGGVGVLLMGMLWSKGIRLPEKGALGPVFGAINQLLIFSPILLVVVIQRQAWTTAWLPRGRLVSRIVAGLVLSVVAVFAYSVLRAGAARPWIMLGGIWRYANLSYLVQVFLEDVTIAILFVRLASAIGRVWASVIVAALFAAGHITAMLSQGATPAEFLALVRDAALGTAVILTLQRSRDVIWFCLIHFCLDMTQFARITGIGS